jgi:2-polyprenyl-6-methoxyphenol hydroxylase-like FAD-dependent oxidoreductase
MGYTTRTMELLQTVGAASQVSGGRQWSGGPPRRIVVKSLAGEWQQEQEWTNKKPQQQQQQQQQQQTPSASGKGASGGPPGLAEFKAASPLEGVAIAQDKIEPILRARAVELGAELRLGYTMTAWSQDEKTGVSVTAVDAEGNEHRFAAQYLIACDGARSAVRETLGIGRQGVGHVRVLRSILFRCPPIDKYLNRGYSQFQIQDREDGFEAFMTTYGDGRWMMAWHETQGQQQQQPDTMTEATQRDWIRKAAGLPDLADADIELLTTGTWDIGGHIADAFSSGRVFLAGDAAHALPPNRGGYGANTGFADAHNLAWKLAAVLAGRARPALLDTYDAERRPVAQVRHDQIFARDDYKRLAEASSTWRGQGVDIIDDVAMEFGQIYRSAGIVGADETLPLAQTPEQWKGQPGTRAPHVPLKKGQEKLSTLDFFGKDWVVISKDKSWQGLAAEASTATGIKCNFALVGGSVEEEADGEFERLFGLGSSGAALVRPDGYIAWRMVNKPDDAGELLNTILAKVSFTAAQ